MEIKNTHNERKTHKTFSTKINSIHKKLHTSIQRLRMYKMETKQLHALCTKLISEGKLTLAELKEHVESREIIKNKIFNSQVFQARANEIDTHNEDEFER